MSKHVILVLEYDMGDYSDIEEDGSAIPENADYYEELFYQSDVLIQDIKIIGARIEEKEN